MADATALEVVAARHAGSTPVPGSRAPPARHEEPGETTEFGSRSKGPTFDEGTPGVSRCMGARPLAEALMRRAIYTLAVLSAITSKLAFGALVRVDFAGTVDGFVAEDTSGRGLQISEPQAEAALATRTSKATARLRPPKEPRTGRSTTFRALTTRMGSSILRRSGPPTQSRKPHSARSRAKVAALARLSRCPTTSSISRTRVRA